MWVGGACVCIYHIHSSLPSISSSLPHTCIYTHHLSPLLPPSTLLFSLFSLFSLPLPPSSPSLSSLPLLSPSPPSLFSLPLLPPSPLPPLPLLPPFTTPKVNFNEPLSMLQRMVEDFIYSDILAKAASCDTTLEELTYVADLQPRVTLPIVSTSRSTRCWERRTSVIGGQS